MKNKLITLRYAMVQSTYWMTFLLLPGFASNYLSGMDVSNGRIGLLLAAAGLVAGLLQPLIGAYADTHGGKAAKKVLFLMSLIMTVLIVTLVFFQHTLSLLPLCLIYTSACALIESMSSLINSLGIYHPAVNFGLARGTGSIAYAALSYGMGYVTSVLGIQVLPSVLLGMLLLFIVSLFVYSADGTLQPSPESAGTGMISFFRRNPSFILLLIGCICIEFGHVLLNSFAYQIAVSLGGGNKEMGIMVAIACAVELPVMFLFTRLLKLLSSRSWVLLSGFGFTLKVLGTYLAPSFAVLYAVQVLQMVGWGLYAVSSVYYVRDIVAPQDEAQGQAYVATAYSAATVLGSLVGGEIIEQAGIHTALFWSVLLAIVGLLLWFLNSRSSRVKTNG